MGGAPLARADIGAQISPACGGARSRCTASGTHTWLILASIRSREHQAESKSCYRRAAKRSADLIAVLWLAIFVVDSALAQQPDFSRQTITIYIGNTAGGTYDLMGRLVARHLGHFLPGSPTVVPENMPGAGTLRAANYVYNVAPKNGTALGIVTETIAVEQALRNPAVQFDAGKLSWIGRVAASNAVHIIWHTSKVQSIEDAKRFSATVAGTGAGNVAETVPTLLNAVIGTKFRIIKGYPAANEAREPPSIGRR
jgi:tripartite-type tricarboxylate transporter receptor subunit TctC